MSATASRSAASRGEIASGCASARSGPARRSGRPLSRAALRRPAPARGACPRHHLPAAPDPARRAARRARCRAAPADAALPEAIQREIRTTFLFVTHDQEEAIAMADRICVMNDGRIQQIGTPRRGLLPAALGVRRPLLRRQQSDRGHPGAGEMPAGCRTVRIRRRLCSAAAARGCPTATSACAPNCSSVPRRSRSRHRRRQRQSPSGHFDEVSFVGPISHVRVRRGRTT